MDVRLGPKADIKIALSGALLCYAASDAMLLIIVGFLVRLTSINCFGINYWLECLECPSTLGYFGRIYDQG